MNTEIRCDNQDVLGERVKLGDGVSIRGRSVKIGDDCTICDGVKILCPDGFEIGSCSYVGPGSRITCWRFQAADYLYWERDNEVGRGGCLNGPDSTVKIGRAFFAGPNVVLNPNHSISIGNEVGMGEGSSIWTHGAYLPVTCGFPAKFASVTIGNRVWLPGHTRILPGVTIGDDVVVGMGSLVNHDLPSRCLAGGVPAKVLRENAFPQDVHLDALAIELVNEYRKSVEWRGIRVEVVAAGERVMLRTADVTLMFDLRFPHLGPDLPPEAEDFRDFLRRRGIRFLTGRPFRSIPHPEVERWSKD